MSFVGLALAVPAGATVKGWRASGVVDAVFGTTSLLPLPATAGDAFVLQFAYDDAAADINPAIRDSAGYPILAMTVSIAGNSLQWVGPGMGEGAVVIQANATDPNLWGVSACLTTCSDPLYDEARLNFFFPPNTILSDALTDPPDPAGASVQLGLFSRDSPAPEEAGLDATLDAPVPEASAAWLLASALAALVGRRAFARAR